MALIYAQNTSTAYGTSSWPERSTMYLSGSDNWPNRVTFPSLSGGRYIDLLSFAFNKETTTSYTATIDCYATDNASILGNNITAAISLGAYSFSGVNGTKTFTFTRSAMDVIQQFTGTWYFLMKGRTGDVRTTWTGGQSTNACIMSGSYTDYSINVNSGGVWKSGEPYVNVGGVWRRGIVYVNVGGVWRQGI